MASTYIYGTVHAETCDFWVKVSIEINTSRLQNVADFGFGVNAPLSCYNPFLLMACIHILLSKSSSWLKEKIRGEFRVCPLNLL